MKNKQIVLKAVEYLHTLDTDTEITTCQLLDCIFGLREEHGGKYWVGTSCLSMADMFEIDSGIRKEAVKSGLMIDTSKYENAVMGLPFHIPYGVKKKEIEQRV